MFQEDLYPATASICPSTTTDEWLAGQNREPILVSLKVRTQLHKTLSMPPNFPYAICTTAVDDVFL